MDGPLEERSLEYRDSNERASDTDEPFAVEIVEDPRCMQTDGLEKGGHRERLADAEKWR